MALGIGSLIIGAFLRMIKMKDRTTEKLNALRTLRKEQMKKRYAGMSVEEQWAADYVTDKNDESDNNNKKK